MPISSLHWFFNLLKKWNIDEFTQNHIEIHHIGIFAAAFVLFNLLSFQFGMNLTKVNNTLSVTRWEMIIDKYLKGKAKKELTCIQYILGRLALSRMLFFLLACLYVCTLQILNFFFGHYTHYPINKSMIKKISFWFLFSYEFGFWNIPRNLFIYLVFI